MHRRFLLEGECILRDVVRITYFFFFFFFLRYIYFCTLGLVTIIDIHYIYFLYMLMYVSFTYPCMCCFFSFFIYMVLFTCVEDKFFTPHGFISLAIRITSTLSWILGKSLLKPKRTHIHIKMRQSPWFKLLAHHLIFWLMIQAHEFHRGNFGSRGLEGQEVCSVKLK